MSDLAQFIVRVATAPRTGEPRGFPIHPFWQGQLREAAAIARRNLAARGNDSPTWEQVKDEMADVAGGMPAFRWLFDRD